MWNDNITRISIFFAVYKDAFSFFDKAGEGSISKNKLAMVMRAMGEDPTDQSIQEMINEVDADGKSTVMNKGLKGLKDFD